MKHNIKRLIQTGAVLLVAGISAAACEYQVKEDVMGSVAAPASVEPSPVDVQVKELQARVEGLQEELAETNEPDGKEPRTSVDLARLQEEIDKLRTEMELEGGVTCLTRLSLLRAELAVCRQASGEESEVLTGASGSEMEFCSSLMASTFADLNLCRTAVQVAEAEEETLELRPADPRETLRNRLGALPWPSVLGVPVSETPFHRTVLLPDCSSDEASAERPICKKTTLFRGRTSWE